MTSLHAAPITTINPSFVIARTHSVIVGRSSYSRLTRRDRVQLVTCEYKLWSLDRQHDSAAADLFEIYSTEVTSSSEPSKYHFGMVKIKRSGRPRKQTSSPQPQQMPAVSEALEDSDALTALSHLDQATYKRRLAAAIAESQSSARAHRAKRRKL
jgi:hypothetical protein